MRPGWGRAAVIGGWANPGLVAEIGAVAAEPCSAIASLPTFSREPPARPRRYMGDCGNG